MQKRHWYQTFMSLMILGTLLAPGMAQDRKPGRRTGYGFLATLEQTVGLSAEQRDSVRGLLASQRQASQALREETDNKIRALLNPEQQKRFDSLLAEQKSQRAARFKRT